MVKHHEDICIVEGHEPSPTAMLGAHNHVLDPGSRTPLEHLDSGGSRSTFLVGLERDDQLAPAIDHLRRRCDRGTSPGVYQLSISPGCAVICNG